MINKIIRDGVWSSILNGELYCFGRSGEEITFIAYEAEELDGSLIDDELAEYDTFLIWIKDGLYGGFIPFHCPLKTEIDECVARILYEN